MSVNHNGTWIGRKLIYAYVAIEIVLFVSIKAAEWKAPYAITGRLEYSAIVLNFLTVLCAVLIQWKGNPAAALSFSDIAIPLALSVTLVADTFLVRMDDIYIAGYFCFGIVQTIYAFYLQMTWKRGVFRIAVYMVFLLVLYLAGYLYAETVVGAWSMSQLVINVVLSWSAYAENRSLGGLLFAIGILLFCGCDTCVAVRNALSGAADSALYRIAAFMVWTFYVPSQVAIVLSYFAGIHWGRLQETEG